MNFSENMCYCPLKRQSSTPQLEEWDGPRLNKHLEKKYVSQNYQPWLHGEGQEKALYWVKVGNALPRLVGHFVV